MCMPHTPGPSGSTGDPKTSPLWRKVVGSSPGMIKETHFLLLSFSVAEKGREGCSPIRNHVCRSAATVYDREPLVYRKKKQKRIDACTITGPSGSTGDPTSPLRRMYFGGSSPGMIKRHFLLFLYVVVVVVAVVSSSVRWWKARESVREQTKSDESRSASYGSEGVLDPTNAR